MQTVHKYPLETMDFQVIGVPQQAKPLKVGYDAAGQLCLWAQVDTDNALEDRCMFVTRTGHPAPGAQATYIDTVFDDQFVWHVWMGI